MDDINKQIEDLTMHINHLAERYYSYNDPVLRQLNSERRASLEEERKALRTKLNSFENDSHSHLQIDWRSSRDGASQAHVIRDDGLICINRKLK